MKGDDIAERLLELGVVCLRLVVDLEKTAAGRHVARQLIAAGTSGGANYEEARSAESASDFVHKVAVAAKEVSETAYWLKIAGRARLQSRIDLAPWIDEAEQLRRILSACKRTARARARLPTARPS